MCCHRKLSFECRDTDDDVELAIARAPLETAANISTGLAPRSGKRAVLGKHIALQLKLIAVAGADQVLIEACAVTTHSVGGTAADKWRKSAFCMGFCDSKRALQD